MKLTPQINLEFLVQTKNAICFFLFDFTIEYSAKKEDELLV